MRALHRPEGETIPSVKIYDPNVGNIETENKFSPFPVASAPINKKDADAIAEVGVRPDDAARSATMVVRDPQTVYGDR